MIHGLIRVYDSRLKVMTDTTMIDRLKEFMECEGRSCSFDPELINPEHVYVLSEFVGDELEILDPYGGALQNYGLCYESLRMTIKKLVKILNEGE